MVRPPEPANEVIEVIANPLNEVNQLRATRAMAQIENNIEAAQRRAALQYDRAVAEAKRTGRSQDVDGVTLADEGIAGAKIDAESHVIIDVAFNQPAYTFEVVVVGSSQRHRRCRCSTGSAAVIYACRPIPIGPGATDVERFCEAETIVFLGRVATPVIKKRGDRALRRDGRRDTVRWRNDAHRWSCVFAATKC